MTSSRDDDALSWAGDSDPTLSAGGVPSQGASADAPLPDGWTVPGRAPERKGAPATRDGVEESVSTASGDDAPKPTSSFALVGVGILAGIYLLYTIGWFLGVTRVGNPLLDPVGRAMFTLGGWLAIAAPLVWFATTYWLTADRPRMRVTWLVLGAILLAPLPLLIGVGGVS